MTLISERARRAQGRLPSGRHALSRKFIVNSQRERIVDATAAIVAAKGLAGLTIPEIARRANVSHQTFYEIYDTKHDAFLGALKVGMHQALLVLAKAYDAHAEDWPRAVAAGLEALIDYLVSEPAHAHLSLVDTFAASPEAIEIRDSALHAFSRLPQPGLRAGREAGREVPAIAAEAITGGVWQILHDYVDNGRISELPDVAPQIIYLALVALPRSSEAAAGAAQLSAAPCRPSVGRSRSSHHSLTTPSAPPMMPSLKDSVSFRRGSGSAGTSTSRKPHSGSQPSAGSHTSRRSAGTVSLTSSFQRFMTAARPVVGGGVPGAARPSRSSQVMRCISACSAATAGRAPRACRRRGG